MQIRPGVSLLQAIAKANEARPVPFSERLADLQGDKDPGRIADVPPPPSTAATKDLRVAKPPAAPPSQDDAAGTASVARQTKPRGSVIDIVI